MSLIKAGQAEMVGNKFVSILKSRGTMKVLNAAVTSGGNYDCFEDSSTDVDYQVPVGKKLIVLGYHCSSTSATPGDVALCWGDNAVANTSTPPTNVRNNNRSFQLTPRSAVSYLNDVYVEVPAEKYPHVFSDNASATIILIGIEVDA